MRLEGKVAIVTGGGSGIGREIAVLFSREGASVVVADYKEDAVEDTEKKINASGGNAISFMVDVTQPVQAKRLVERALETYEAIDILVNSAGTLFFGTILDTDEQTWDRVIATNLTGTYLCSRAVLPHMIRHGGGSIVNMSSSTGAHDAAGNSAAYVASKGGVALLTKAMAVDHAKDNVRVNAIAPGPTDTPMLRDNVTEEFLKKFVMDTIPMQRLGKPSEIASTALFLVSDEASFITGAVIPVDGGQTAQI
jgi:meso-butanediol dehydrogenase/(S,S)-butanediol dehydrogenase/diacetyl reductase